MLDPSRIKAITLDLDDTLWPIWPTIARAEVVLTDWLSGRAPATVALLADAEAKRRIRAETEAAHPQLGHDLSALRREAIRHALREAGDDPALADPAFEVFFDERQRVQLFEDALPALERLSARYPLVALSNGNADLQRVGLARYFKGGLSAREFGIGKPDRRIFEAAAALAGVSAADTLHVGDDAHLDGVGALGAGMQLAWLNRGRHEWPHPPLQPHLTVADLLVLCEHLG
jgi:putative hydrolase of the HAD superfamily